MWGWVCELFPDDISIWISKIQVRQAALPSADGIVPSINGLDGTKRQRQSKSFSASLRWDVGFSCLRLELPAAALWPLVWHLITRLPGSIVCRWAIMGHLSLYSRSSEPILFLSVFLTSVSLSLWRTLTNTLEDGCHYLCIYLRGSIIKIEKFLSHR